MFELSEIFVSVISLFLGGLLGAEISRFLYRPRVNVRYDQVLPLIAETGTYWSIDVINLGRTAALQCKGVISFNDLQANDLLDYNEADEDEYLPDFLSDPDGKSGPSYPIYTRSWFRKPIGLYLCWSQIQHPAKTDINPGTSERLEIFKMHKSANGNYLVFPTENGYRQVHFRTRAQTLNGFILVCPANEFPAKIEFSITKTLNDEWTFEGRRNQKLRLRNIYDVK
jgi:hypothetical protein